MNKPVDLTKCQPGDLLRLRDESIGIYIKVNDGFNFPHVYLSMSRGIATCKNDGAQLGMAVSSIDVVAIVHPTRAEIEEQRRELLVALKELRSFYIASTGLTPHAANAAIARVEAPHE